MSSLIRGYASLTAQQKATVGDVKMSAVGTDHMGWLLCDGRLLNIADWRALHNAIGNQFGGDGTTTFRLPNPAGRVLGTIGAGSGLTSRALGASVGTETHMLTVDEMPDHSHTITDVQHSHDYIPTNSNNTQVAGVIVGGPNVNDGVGGATATTSEFTGITATNFTGGVGSSATSAADPDGPPVAATAHNNMQPTLFIGNTFIFSGKPTNGTWPLAYNSSTPLSTYGGMPQIL